jgi:hypothetical protein
MPPLSRAFYSYAEYVELSYAKSALEVHGPAIRAVGWDVGLAVELELFGVRLIVCAVLVRDEIARRNAEQLGPVTDPWLLRCHADLDQGFLSRPTPVEIVGALASRRGWAAAREAACTFTAFGPRVAVLPPKACRPAVLMEALVTGIGIVCWDGCTASVLAAPGSPPTGLRTHVHRLVEEIVWDALQGEEKKLATPRVLPA